MAYLNLFFRVFSWETPSAQPLSCLAGEQGRRRLRHAVRSVRSAPSFCALCPVMIGSRRLLYSTRQKKQGLKEGKSRKNRIAEVTGYCFAALPFCQARALHANSEKKCRFSPFELKRICKTKNLCYIVLPEWQVIDKESQSGTYLGTDECNRHDCTH